MSLRPNHNLPSALVAALCAALACEGLTEPRLPASAVHFAAHAQYAFWWQRAQACSGLTGDLSAVEWYTVPGVDAFTVGGEQSFAGLWILKSNQIILAGHDLDNGQIVRHEMLHALAQTGGHPRDLFQRRCAGLVACANECVRDGGSLPDPPADAEVVAPHDLTRSMEVAPTVVTDADNGGWAIVTLSVTNPRPHPVWVALVSPHAGNTYPMTYGFELSTRSPVSTVGWIPTIYEMEAQEQSRIGFGGGETKHRSFDVHLQDAGSYLARALFNGDTLAVASIVKR